MHHRTLLLASFCLLLAVSAALAGEPPVSIEGMILVSGSDEVQGDHAYFMEGSSDDTTPAPAQFLHGEISPHMDRVVYSMRDSWPPTVSDVWTADIDGSAEVNITQAAGLGGVSCRPTWSPDASVIAFMHADPGAEVLPCDAGWHVWVINADGTGAHRVTAPTAPPTLWPAWSPNGFRLVLDMWEVGRVTIDIDGTDLSVLPNVEGMPDWSPDGSKIASSAFQSDVVEGEPGTWRQLLLTNADGSNPEVLVQQFIKESDIAYHLGRGWPAPPEGFDWEQHVRALVGPLDPEWSPRGNRIVFQAALPFDPDGPYYPYQVELWVYDLDTEDLTRITNDLSHDYAQSWNGPNTFPTDPEVTVDDVTVTFSEVSGEGVTTIMRDDDPPEVPAGFQFDYEFYELATTAEVTGPVTICMTYTDEEVPPEAEGDLAILHWDGEQWIDITISRDTANNIICGQTDSLSPIALQGIRRTRFPDVPAWGFGDNGLDPHWAYYNIMACVEAGIVAGYPDGSYQPGAAVTRAQMAVYIARALAGGEEGVPEFTGTPSFPDVDETHWALGYVEYAAGQNVIAGYGDSTYHPDEQVNRAQMAVYVARALVAPEGEAGLADYVPADPRDFPDVPSDHWAYTHIEYCVENGVVSGYLDGSYHPEAIVTRDQMAVYVARAFGLTG